MSLMFLISVLCSFLITNRTLPRWITIAKRSRIVGLDMNKLSKPEIAEMGGTSVLLGFICGVFVFFLIGTYTQVACVSIKELALLLTVSICGIIGGIDDLTGWKKGLRQLSKSWLCSLAALPLVLVNLNRSEISISPDVTISFGLVYPLILIPIGVTATANGFNTLAGYNGLEGRMGFLITVALGIASWRTGNYSASVVCLCMASALVAFDYYNRYPARVFPGNILTYTVGALVGSIAIVAHLELIAMCLFVLYLFQFLLKARGRFQVESFAKPGKSGTLVAPYLSVYGLEHLVIRILCTLRGYARETDVVKVIIVVETLVCFLVLYLI